VAQKPKTTLFFWTEGVRAEQPMDRPLVCMPAGSCSTKCLDTATFGELYLSISYSNFYLDRHRTSYVAVVNLCLLHHQELDPSPRENATMEVRSQNWQDPDPALITGLVLAALN